MYAHIAKAILSKVASDSSHVGRMVVLRLIGLELRLQGMLSP